MSVKPVTAYVQAHGLVYRDADFIDRDFDEIATEDPEDRERGLFESPSRYLARTSNRRGDQPSSVPNSPASPPPAGRPDHDAAGIDSSPMPAAVAPIYEKSPRGGIREGS